MTNAKLKLIFAGGLTLVALLLAGAVVIVCILKGLSSEATLALCGPFAVVVTSGITFFLGNSNGIQLVKEQNGGGH